MLVKMLQGGDLSEAMSNDKTGRLRWCNRGQYVALDVVRGLSYLHACKVCQHLACSIPPLSLLPQQCASTADKHNGLGGFSAEQGPPLGRPFGSAAGTLIACTHQDQGL